MTTEPIRVWRYEDAPKELQDLSSNGGDEDWLAEVPPSFREAFVWWLEPGTPFGCSGVEVKDHPAKPGWQIHIGSHS